MADGLEIESEALSLHEELHELDKAIELKDKEKKRKLSEWIPVLQPLDYRKFDRSHFEGRYHGFLLKNKETPLPGTALEIEKQQKFREERRSKIVKRRIDAIGRYHEQKLKKLLHRSESEDKLMFEVRLGPAERNILDMFESEENFFKGKGFPKGRNRFQHPTIYKESIRVINAGHNDDSYPIERALRNGFQGADLQENGRRGDTSMTAAASVGGYEAVRTLLQGGASPNICNDFGQFPINCVWNFWTRQVDDGKVMRVTSKKRREEKIKSWYTMRELLTFGADPNLSPPNGWTALHEAARRGSIDLVLLLLRFKADPLPVDKRGRTPRDVVCKYISLEEQGQMKQLLRVWGSISQDIRKEQFLQHWIGFTKNPNITLGASSPIKKILADIATMMELKQLEYMDRELKTGGGYMIIDEIITGPVDVPDTTETTSSMVAGGSAAELREKGKPPGTASSTSSSLKSVEFKRGAMSQPTRHAGMGRLEVRLDAFLLGKVPPPFTMKFPEGYKRPSTKTKDKNSKEGEPMGKKNHSKSKTTSSEAHMKIDLISKKKPKTKEVFNIDVTPQSEINQTLNKYGGKVPLAIRRQQCADTVIQDMKPLNGNQIKKSATTSKLLVGVSLEDIPGTVDEGAEDKMEIKAPPSGDLYGKRLVTRRRANAKEMDAYKESIKAVTAVIPVDFIETKDIVYKHIAEFNPESVIPGKTNVTVAEPLQNEDLLHASHPRQEERKANKRAINEYPHYEDPWKSVSGFHKINWHM